MDIDQAELDALKYVPVKIGKAVANSAATVTAMAVASASWSRHEQRRLRLDVVGWLCARGGLISMRMVTSMRLMTRQQHDNNNENDDNNDNNDNYENCLVFDATTNLVVLFQQFTEWDM